MANLGIDVGELVWVFLFGVALLAFVAWARAGRTSAARWWPGSIWNEAAIICVLPGLGLFSAAGAAAAAFGGPSDLSPALLALALCLFFIAVAGRLAGLVGCAPGPDPATLVPEVGVAEEPVPA